MKLSFYRITKGLLYLFIIISLFASCSTEKNTSLTRTYHNLTAHYNIFFNGYESYSKGIEKLENTYEYDYSQILPVYLVANESNAGSLRPEMDRAQKKATKVIDLHSIKAKPEFKKANLTSKDREFLKKNEYNKWVDKNYLLIGKAYFQIRNFSLANETFRFMLREFDEEPILYETRVWMAKTYLELKDYQEVLNILNDLDADKKKMDKRILSEYNAVFAQYYISQKEYENAYKRLNKALKEIKGKNNKIRYTFILAQLSQLSGNNSQAFDLYKKVIKMNPPYEMTFNAKINMAGSFEKGHTNSHNIRDELRKMLKDDKNIDFHDQIYYALANIDFTEGNLEGAIENYKRSAKSSVANDKQKARSYLAVADIYYEKPEYVLAQSYYDSAVVLLSENYPGFDIIKAKSEDLSELVYNIKSVQLQDSLQHLATLSEKQRIEIVDGIIAEIERQEREAMEEEKRRAQEIQEGRLMESPGISSNQGSSWYFYNLTAKSYGQKEFKLKWGSRKLEDNWRRKNKSLSSGDQLTISNENENTGSQTNEKVNKKSREYYLKNIPDSDSAIQKSHEIIKESLINIGLIYKNKLNDIDLSVQAFEDLIKRYPDDNITASAYYNLYLVYRNTNPSKAEQYKKIIIRNYPGTNFAKVLTDPEYFKELEKKENEATDFYSQTYNMFNNGQYQQVINNSRYAVNKFNDPDLVSKFKYLEVLSIGKTSNPTAFREALYNFIETTGNPELKENASTILKYLDNVRPDAREEHETELATELYKFTPFEPHYVIVTNNEGKKQLDQLSFNILNFNLDNFDMLNLSIDKETIGTSSVIKIQPFKDRDEAYMYLLELKGNENIYKDVAKDKTTSFIISDSNYKILIDNKNIERYLLFFNNNY